MTSWLTIPPKKLVDQEKSFLFETFDSDAWTNFTQFLYAHIYAGAEGRTLQVYDRSNNISFRIPLIQNTFSDISGVTYKDTMPSTASNTAKVLPRILSHVMSLPLETVRQRAKQIFQWSPTLITSIRESISKVSLPGEMDLGINLRSNRTLSPNELRAASVDEIVRAAKKFQVASKKSNLNIFVMKDNILKFTELTKKADPSWALYTLPMPIHPDSQIVRQTARNAERDRIASYVYEMAELFLMQNIPDMISSLSTSTGRFLYLTVDHPERIVSLGAPKFSYI